MLFQLSLGLLRCKPRILLDRERLFLNKTSAPVDLSQSLFHTSCMVYVPNVVACLVFLTASFCAIVCVVVRPHILPGSI